jgi:hypothetical protein
MPNTSKIAEAREKPWDNRGAVAFSHGISSPLNQTFDSLFIDTSSAIRKIEKIIGFEFH